MAEATIGTALADTGQVRADLGMILGRSARRFGSRPALITDTRTFTYAELDELCDRAAGGDAPRAENPRRLTSGGPFRDDDARRYGIGVQHVHQA